MAIQTIRPDADVLVKQYLNQALSASNLWQVIDDNPVDDATYIRAQADYPSGLYRARLSNLSALTAPDVAGKLQRIRYIQIFYRAWSASAGTFQNTYITWRDAGDAKTAATVSSPREFTSTKSGTPGTHTGVKRIAAPGRLGEWTEALVNRGQLEMYSTKGQRCRVGDAWVEVFVDDRPVVSAVTVADANATSQPTASWTYTDTQEDPQIAFQLRVYTLAETQRVGFSPYSDQFKTVYDSGAQVGDATSFGCGVDLVNGQQYVFYVRAAQNFNGSRWWSAWAASGTVTISVTPPTPPTLSVATDSSVPNLRSLLTAAWVAGGGFTQGSIALEACDLATRSLNLCSPQLATGGSFYRSTEGFYFNQAGDTLAWDQAFALPGQEGSIRWDVLQANATGAVQVGGPLGTYTTPPDHFIPATPGRTYVASVYARADASFQGALTVQPIDALGNAVGGNFSTGAQTIGTGALAAQRFQVSWTQPAGASGARVRVSNSSAVSGRKVWTAGWKVREGVTETEDPEPGMGTGRLSWGYVRGADALSAITGQNVVGLDDEQAPDSYRLYRARSIVALGVAGSQNSSIPTYVPVVYMPPPGSGQWVLVDPAGSLGSLQVVVTPNRLAEEIVEQATDFDPLGREFGVTISDVIGGLDGKLTFYTDTERAWQRLLPFLKAQRTLQLKYPSGGAKYVRLRSRSILRAGHGSALKRWAECDYKQRGRP